MNRRFYVFNDCDTVASHVSQVKTSADLNQLIFDIRASATNRTAVIKGHPGVWFIDCYACTPTQIHVFMSQEAFRELGGLTETEVQQVTSFTVLED